MEFMKLNKKQEHISSWAPISASLNFVEDLFYKEFL